MSQDYIIWLINDKAYELDLQDADTADKYEAAFKRMGEDEKSMPKDGTASDKIRAYHKIFVNLYDFLFGEGAGTAILGESANTRICNEVYDSFLSFVSKQKSQSLEFRNSITSRFSAERAQRGKKPVPPK